MELIRKRLIKGVGFLLLCLMVGQPFAAWAQSLPSGLTENDLGVQIPAFVAEREETNAGLAVAVFDPEGTRYTEQFGYADKENNLPVTEETVFEWGSISKLMIWVSVMQLEEQGLIDLEENIRRYLPETFIKDTHINEPVTMRQLMNHTGGFQSTLIGTYATADTDPGSLEEALRTSPPLQIYTPGTVTAYSNWGAALAAYVVEQVSGEDYATYVKNNILIPLGMEHTAVYADLSDNSLVQEKRQELQGYNVNGDLLAENFYQIPLYPAGMATGTLSDLVRFGQALIPAEGEESALFEESETLETLLTPTNFFAGTDTPRNAHGFWAQFYAVPVWGHAGNTPGNTAVLQLNRDSGIGAAVLVNQTNDTRYTVEMLDLVFGAFEEGPYAAEVSQVPSGLYRDATTLEKGPLKIFQVMSFRNPSEDPNLTYWQPGNWQGQETLQTPYRDLLPVAGASTTLQAVVSILWIIGVFYAFFSLLLSLLGTISRALGSIPARGQGLIVATCSFEKWHILACGLIVFVLVNLMMFAVQVLTFVPEGRIYIRLVFFAVLMVGLLTYIIMLGLQWKKIDCMRPEKIKFVVTAFFSATSILMIVYWQLYRFWML